MSRAQKAWASSLRRDRLKTERLSARIPADLLRRLQLLQESADDDGYGPPSLSEALTIALMAGLDHLGIA